MSSFSPQRYRRIGRNLRIDGSVLDRAIAVADRITAVAPHRAVIFTLRHLAALTNVPYPLMRDWVGRWGEEPYRQFFLSKKSDRRRTKKPGKRPMRRIAAPSPALMRQQRWLVARVLHHAPRHPASMAFHKGSDIVEAARLHCGCHWLIKMDIQDFFESIHEPAVFNVFVELGYPRLLAFELTRLCTRVVPLSQGKEEDLPRHSLFHAGRGPAFYNRALSEGAKGGEMMLPLGSLPQGAPTSPLLANLVVRALDTRLAAIAADHDLVYTRYADDIALSTTRRDFSRKEAAEVIGKVLRELDHEGLRPHHAKTRLIPPGARKIVLGLVVDGREPRLTREYRNKLRLHAHMLGTRSIPPSRHAAALRFRSVLSMRRHIEGKIVHARRVERDFANAIAQKLSGVDWTL